LDNLQKNNKQHKIDKKNTKVEAVRTSYNEMILSPSLQNAGRASVIIGFIGRALIVYIGTLGLTTFLTDAFLIDINIPLFAAILLLFTALLSVMSINKKSFFAGAGVLLLSLMITFVAGKPFEFLPNTVSTIWNHMLGRLAGAGFNVSLNLYMVSDQSFIFTEEQIESFMFGGVVLFAFLIAVILALSIMRRIHLIPVLVIYASIITGVFTYNISSSNWGFVFILTSITGILTVKMYDGIYNRRKPSKKEQEIQLIKNPFNVSSYGGLAGLLSMIICFCLLVGPALLCRERWVKIDFINEKMQYGRAVVSSVLLGNHAATDLGFIGNMDTLNSRSTATEFRTFTGREIMKVHASFNLPIYVRSWTADSYDNENNKWVSVSNEEAAAYREQFGADFTPEIIYNNFIEFLNPSYTNISSFKAHIFHDDIGYVTETIDIENISSAGNLLYTVSSYNPNYGILKFNTDDPADEYSKKWQYYYDGIVMSSWFNFDKNYRMTAFVPLYRNPNFSANFANNIEYYSVMKYFISEYNNANTVLSEEEKVEFIKTVEETLTDKGIVFSSPTAVERYLNMNEEERAEFVYDYFILPEYYESFVTDNYTETPESSYLDIAVLRVQLAYLLKNGMITAEDAAPLGISLDENGTIVYTDITYRMQNDTEKIDAAFVLAGNYSDVFIELGRRYDIILETMNYLRCNYHYTLLPKQSKNYTHSALDEFLNYSKEGYCVQFATAATMILRDMGIPTRYCEGYFVSDFVYESDVDRVAKYRHTVRDKDAHAWVEVYMGAAGWMTYEAKSVYYDVIYTPEGDPGISPVLPDVNSGSYIDINRNDDKEKDTPDNLGKEDQYTVFTKENILALSVILGVLLIAVLIVLLIYRMYSISVRVREKRLETINRALRASLPEDEMRDIARDLHKYIWQFHEVAGCMPKKGELPQEYCRRVDDSFNTSMFSFSDIYRYMSSEEFGYGMKRWQLSEMAEYTVAIMNKLQNELTFFEKIKYRVIKRMV